MLHLFSGTQTCGGSQSDGGGGGGGGKLTTIHNDSSKFFDRVHHQRLLGRMDQRVGDGRVLKLVHRMLKAKVVLPDATREVTKEGTPQGGPLAPPTILQTMAVSWKD